MLSRMRAATAGGPVWPESFLGAREEVVTIHKTASVGKTELLPGSVLAATGGDTRRRIEDVLRTYTDIGAAGATPDHRWRAADHFRPYHALGALTEMVEALVHERLRLSGRADPGSEG